MEEKPVTRRAAVDLLLRGSSAVLVTGLVPSAGCAQPPLSVDLGQVPEGSALTTKFGEQLVLVVNTGGTIRALSGRCTHEGCELRWNPRQQLIRCPCHGSAFDTGGQVKRGPAKDPLPVYRTTVRGRTIGIWVP